MEILQVVVTVFLGLMMVASSNSRSSSERSQFCFEMRSSYSGELRFGEQGIRISSRGNHDDEDEVEDDVGGLSTSGKELKKLLGKAARLEESDGEEEDEDVNEEDENAMSFVLAPKQKIGVKDEAFDNSPSKMSPASYSRATPSSTKSKLKKKPTPKDARMSNTPLIKKEECLVARMQKIPSWLFLIIMIWASITLVRISFSIRNAILKQTRV